jgi:beta-lactam-binding protein with PASTA domain
MSFFRILKSKRFLTNLAVIIVLTIVIIWGILKFLDYYTLHGKFITVPDFTGLTEDDLDKFSSDRYLKYIIVDSIHDNSKEKGSVIAQDPLPNTKVKDKRKIYLTIVAKQPEKVDMPNLVDLTLRQATVTLKIYELRLGVLEYIPDIAKNAVLKQKYKGEIIVPETRIEKGSIIDLILGQGLKHEKTKVPVLLGMTREEAIKNLKESSLNIGAEIFENIDDTANARVYKQRPACYKKKYLFLGQSIDLWYKSNKKFDFKTFIKQHKPDTVHLKADTSLL